MISSSFVGLIIKILCFMLFFNQFNFVFEYLKYKKLWNTAEYLIFVVIFLLYLKITEGATVDLMKSTMTSTPPAESISTTTESSVRKADVSSSNIYDSKLKRTLQDCQNTFSWMCLKLELIRLLEIVAERDEICLVNGISLIKDPEANVIKTSEIMTEVARSYPNDPTARLNGFIINKIHNIFQTHYLRFKLIDDQVIEEARSLLETGRKDKKKGGMEGLIAAGLMMKGTLMAMGMSGIALIAGKALLTALMALTMAAVVGLKSMGGGGGKSHTYEIVTKPIYSHDESSHGAHMGHSGTGYGGYARTLDLNLPYSQRGSVKMN